MNILHSEYQELGENYSKLEEAYTAAVSQLQQSQPDAQKIIEELEENLQGAADRIEYLES